MDTQLRAGWQTVADFIDAAAERFVQKKDSKPSQQPIAARAAPARQRAEALEME